MENNIINDNMRNAKLNRICAVMLLFYIAIQPVFELKWFNNGVIGEIGGFTIPTLVRFGMIAIIGVLSLFTLKFNRCFYGFALYITVAVVYAVLHHIFCTGFNSLIPGEFGYSIVGEMFYLCRLLLPMIVIYLIYNLEIKEKYIKNVIIWVCIFSTALVVITNITKTSDGSYTSVRILGNIFDWFINEGAFTFNQLASKGFFYSSIFSIAVVLLYSFTIYLYFTDKSEKYILLVIAQGISLYMFGTKAATLSVIIIQVLMLCVYFVCSVLKKDIKFSKRKFAIFALVIVLFGAILPYTPSLSRISFDEHYMEEIDLNDNNKDKPEIDDENEPDEKHKSDIEFIENNIKTLSIKESFLTDSYNYKYDTDFWMNIIETMPPSERMKNRIIEQAMFERVKEINNDKMDDYFGLGYTRTTNIYNLEKDYLYQYYSVGIAGVIVFLGPYIAGLVAVIALMLIKFKERVTIKNCSIVLGIGLTHALALYSGNTIDNLGITILLGLMYGYVFKSIFKDN